MKIFAAGIATETNTFSPIPTGLKSFEESFLGHGDTTDRDIEPFTAPLHVWRKRCEADGHQWCESLCTFAQPAGPTVGKVYEALRDEILDDLNAAMPVDVVLLGLHGAMVAHGYDDCEGDLIHQVRAIAGPDVSIGVELDPHCHLTEAMLEHATILVCFKEYPHVDITARAEEVYQLACDAAAGKTKPVMRDYDCKMMSFYHTPFAPMREFVDSMSAREGHDGVLSVSLAHGFPWGDVPRVGTRMLVICDDNAAQATEIAREFGQKLFSLRDQISKPYPDIEQALDLALDGPAGSIVLADVADNAGGGAPSDATFMLDAILRRGLDSVTTGIYWDPIVVRLCEEAGVGAQMQIRLGGKMGEMSGQPIDLLVTVKAVETGLTQRFGDIPSPLGTVVYLQHKSINIVVNDMRTQTFHPEAFTGIGIDLSASRLIIVKSSQHFYAGFEPIAAKIIHVATPGSITPNFREIPYVRRERNFWPVVDNPFQ